MGTKIWDDYFGIHEYEGEGIRKFYIVFIQKYCQRPFRSRHLVIKKAIKEGKDQKEKGGKGEGSHQGREDREKKKKKKEKKKKMMMTRKKRKEEEKEKERERERKRKEEGKERKEIWKVRKGSATEK